MAGIILLSDDEILELGIQSAGIIRGTACLNTTKKRFRSSYGLDPPAFNELMSDLQTVDIGDKQIEQFDPFYLLMTLYWLRHYIVEPILAAVFRVNEKTARKWCWKYALAIQALKETKVRCTIV
jgi:hypothetical protein